MASNLSLNPCKTEFPLIGFPSKLSKTLEPVLRVSSDTLIPLARNLGVIFDHYVLV